MYENEENEYIENSENVQEISNENIQCKSFILENIISLF